MPLQVRASSKLYKALFGLGIQNLIPIPLFLDMSSASQIALLMNETRKVRNCRKSFVLLCASDVFEHCCYKCTFTLVPVSFSVRPIYLKLWGH